MRLVCAWLLALASFGCFAPERPPLSGRVEAYDFPARAFDETFRLFVRVPPQYDAEPERRFPLVVQLDANLPTLHEFEVTAGVASQLEALGRAGPCVVVGLGYATSEEAQRERSRDFTPPIGSEAFARVWGATAHGEADRLYDFLRDELAPHLDETLRLSGERALFGHSLGGLFTVHALLRHDDAAPLFTGFVAGSPSLFWDDGQLLARWDAAKAPSTRLLLFAGAGQLEGPEMMGFFDEFAARVRARPRANVDVEVRAWERVDHVGSVTPSFREGLESLFARGFGGGR